MMQDDNSSTIIQQIADSMLVFTKVKHNEEAELTYDPCTKQICAQFK